MCKIWELIINGKLSCVKNKSKASSVHTCVDGCSIPGDREHWMRKRFHAEDQGLRVFELAEF